MRTTWRTLAFGLAVALVVVGCSSGDGDESAGEVADATTTTVDVLQQVVLPGQPDNPAATTTSLTGAPASSVVPGAGSTSTTVAPTPAPTSAPLPTTTTTTSAPTASTSTTTTTAPPRAGLPFGPTILVDGGESASTFQWEMATIAPDRQSNVSVEWLIDGTSESMSLVDDNFDEMLVRIGEQYWATNQAGDVAPTDAATFGQRRQAYLDETFATGIGLVMSPSDLDGPGRYVVSTADQAVIGAVLGGQPLAGSTMEGTVDVDTAGRLVGWTLDVTQPGPAGQAPTTFSLTGSIAPGVATPITPP